MSEKFSNVFRRVWKLEWKWDDIEWLENWKKKILLFPVMSSVKNEPRDKKEAQPAYDDMLVLDCSFIGLPQHPLSHLILTPACSDTALTGWQVSWAGVNDAQQNRLAQTMDSCFF
jgi:hypothetical protein